MWADSDALQVLRKNQIPFHAGVNGVDALLRRRDIDVSRLRSLGFRISQGIHGQWVVSYKGNRFGIIL